MARRHSHDWQDRDAKTGGAGARRQPLTDDDYRRARRRLEALNAADSRAQEEDDV